MKTLKAYSGDLKKADLLADLKAHRAADRIAHGFGYWDNNQARGCAVGCGIESARRRLGLKNVNHGDHALLARVLDVPVELIWMQDDIFEGMPRDPSFDWPYRFAEAIQEGSDTSRVADHLMVWTLKVILIPEVSKFDDLAELLPLLKELLVAHERRAEGKKVKDAELDDIWKRLEVIARARARASAIAIAIAIARARARASASASARARASASARADHEQAYVEIGDKLLELLRAAPIPA